MRAKPEQKSRTREAILASASRLVRERGISGARVADVMKGAGLTVGGFYAHFATKEALVDDVLRRTAEEMRRRLFAGLEDRSPLERLERILERYLSASHRDEVAQGCPFPAVGGEGATGAGEHPATLQEGVEPLASELGGKLPDASPASRRTNALAVIAIMFGGLTFARALRGTAISDEILRACRAFARRGLRDGDVVEDQAARSATRFTY